MEVARERLGKLRIHSLSQYANGVMELISIRPIRGNLDRDAPRWRSAIVLISGRRAAADRKILN